MLFAHNVVLDALPQGHIYQRLMERRHAIGADDVVLTQGQASWARRGGTQSAGVLEGEEVAQLGFWRLVQVDLAEVDDGTGMGCDDGAAGGVCLLLGEDGEGMRQHGGMELSV